MPVLWRISDFADLNGEGGRLVDGRWHSRGQPIVYLAEHPALALLENIVHLDIDLDDIPAAFQLLEIDVPDTTTREAIAAGDLESRNPDWRSEVRFTQALGDLWLATGKTCLCYVPSVILPKSTNILFNPAHPEARLARIASLTQPPYDPRLFHRG